MVRVIILLAIIAAFLFAVKLIMDHRSVERPERIGRKDRKAFEANYLTLQNLVNEIDVDARTEEQVTGHYFANQVSMKIAKARKELA